MCQSASVLKDWKASLKRYTAHIEFFFSRLYFLISALTPQCSASYIRLTNHRETTDFLNIFCQFVCIIFLKLEVQTYDCFKGLV